MGSEIVLGIDFGSRRIGLATGHRLTGRARPLKTLDHSGAPFAGLDKVLAEWRPRRVIVGLPLDAGGGESAMSLSVREFAAELGRRHPELTIELHDERLTTRAAAGDFADARRAGAVRRKQARDLDSRAAALILESWLAENPDG